MTGIDGRAAIGRPLAEVVPDLETRGLLAIVREPLESGAHAGARAGAARPLHRLSAGHAIGALHAHAAARRDRRARRKARTRSGSSSRSRTSPSGSSRSARSPSELRQASPDARRRAIEQLASVEPVEGIGPLHHAIGDEDWQVRRRGGARARRPRRCRAGRRADRRAARQPPRFQRAQQRLQLLAMTGVDVTAALVDLLHHPDADLRIQAALALGSADAARGGRRAARGAERPGCERPLPRDRVARQAGARRGGRTAGGDRRVERLLPGVPGARRAVAHQRPGGGAAPRAAARRRTGRRSGGRSARPDRRRGRGGAARRRARSARCVAGSSIVDALATIHRHYARDVRQRRADRGSACSATHLTDRRAAHHRRRRPRVGRVAAAFRHRARLAARRRASRAR